MESECDICGCGDDLSPVRLQGTSFRRKLTTCQDCRHRLTDLMKKFIDGQGIVRAKTEFIEQTVEVPVDRIIMRREIGPGISRWWVVIGALVGFGVAAVVAALIGVSRVY